MARRFWRIEKVTYCLHVGREVALEDEVVYPADQLPDQPPRVLAHRCSNAVECNLMFEKPACAWCGTNPGHEPA